MSSPEPILIPKALFDELDVELLTLLRGLAAEDWRRPTVCSQWCVQDIAAHLLDGTLRRLSIQRDGYRAPDAPDSFASYPSLVAYLDRLNATWTTAARRLSPTILIELLEQFGPQYNALLASLAPAGPAIFPVAWAGETASQNWLDVAREYTEKWHHQQQIADAVGKSGRITTRRLYFPVLDSFMRALPFTVRRTEAPEGACLQVCIDGDAGGAWAVRREGDDWRLTTGLDGTATATVKLPADVAWRVFTKRRSAEESLAAFPAIQISGDRALGEAALELVAIMA